MKKIHITFSDVPIDAAFYCNGNLYTKKSTRTAYLIEYKKTFYFSQKEWVVMMQEEER